MQDAPPAPLPINPRMNPPRPRTSHDAMQEAALLSTTESAAVPSGTPGEDIQADVAGQDVDGMEGMGKIALNVLGTAFEKAAGGFGGWLAKQTPGAASWLGRQFGGAAKATAPMAPSLRGMAAPVTQPLMGAAAGAFGGSETPFDTGSTWGNAAAGAAAFNPWTRRLMGSRGAGAVAAPGVRAVQGGLLGATGGQGLDVLATQAGLQDTHFGRMGGALGTGFGALSGAGRMMNTLGQGTRMFGRDLGALGKQVQQFGQGGLSPVTTPLRTLGRMVGYANPVGTGIRSAPAAGGRALAGLAGITVGGQQVMHGVTESLKERMLPALDEYANAKVPEIADYLEGRTHDALGQMGALNQQGQLDGSQMAQRSMGSMAARVSRQRPAW